MTPLLAVLLRQVKDVIERFLTAGTLVAEAVLAFDSAGSVGAEKHKVSRGEGKRCKNERCTLRYCTRVPCPSPSHSHGLRRQRRRLEVERRP